MENHPAFYAENNAHATKGHAAELRKQAQALLDLADDLDIAANLGIHYSQKAQGKQVGTIPAGKHNPLKCKNGDHDDCMRAQLASGNQDERCICGGPRLSEFCKAATHPPVEFAKKEREGQ